MTSKAIGRKLATLLFLATLVATAPAFGQRSSTFVPRRETMSPYFGLFQVNTTPLPNYQANVRPIQQLQNSQLTQRREGVRIDRLERQIELRDTAGASGLLRRSPGAVGTPSRAGTFMNLNQFYPNHQAVQRRR